MATSERPQGGESGRLHYGKRLSERTSPPASAPPYRRGRSPTRDRAHTGDDSKSLIKHRHHSPSPRRRDSRDRFSYTRPHRRSLSVASRGSDTYRPREVVNDSKGHRKLHSPSNRHRHDSLSSRKRRRSRSPSTASTSNRRKDRRRSRSAGRSPPRPRKLDSSHREVDRAFRRKLSRSRSPRPVRDSEFWDSRSPRRLSSSPPHRLSDSYIPPDNRRHTPSSRDSRLSRRRSPSPSRNYHPRHINHSRRSPPPDRSYKNTERTRSGRAREKVGTFWRSPSVESRTRRLSPSPVDKRHSSLRERPPSSYRTLSPRPPPRRSRSPRETKKRENFTRADSKDRRNERPARDHSPRRGRSHSPSVSPPRRGSPRPDSRDRDMYNRGNPYYPPQGRPPPIDTRFSSSAPQGYPPHRGGYGGPSPHGSYHGSPTHSWSPQQSPYHAGYPPHGPPSQNYPQQGGYSPQGPHQNQGYPQQHNVPQPPPHSGSPSRGGRGAYRGNMMNGAPARTFPSGQTQNQNQSYSPPAQRPAGAHYSNLTWKPGVGTRGGHAPTTRIGNTASSSQSSQAQSVTIRDDGTAETIDEDADDNPFRPAKELRAKEHKLADSPIKSNREAEERRGSEDSMILARQDQIRRGSEPTSMDKKNMPPPNVSASQTSQSPKISFNLKAANVSKALAVAPKPDLFQAKPPPVQNSLDRRPEPRPSIAEPPRPRYDDRRPYDRRFEPYLRDNYYRDGRHDPRDLRDRRDFRPDPKFDRYERDRQGPREFDRTEPPRKVIPRPDVKVLVVKEIRQVWRELDGWKMFPKPTGYGPDGRVRWGQNQELEKPPRPPPRMKCLSEHEIPPERTLPPELNVAGKSVYPRKAGGESVVGSGTYGKVYKSINVYKHEQGHVALKKVILQGEKDGFPFTAVREIRTLIPIRSECIPRLLESMVEKNEPYMIFEYVPFDLAGLINHTSFHLTSAHKKDLAKQMYEGLIWLHSQGILHRDVKAANILVCKDGGLKLTDFGLCKTFNVKKGARQEHTNRVVTIWYRAPELLLGEICYGTEIDFWAAACVLIEILANGQAIFPGPGTDIMQLDAIFSVLGKPTVDEWSKLNELPWWPLVLSDEEVGRAWRDQHRYRRRFEERYQKKLSPQAFDLLLKAFRWDPEKRPDGREVLEHPYFTKEEPAPKRVTELENLDADFHEWDYKLRKRAERKAKDEERERAKKEGRLAEKRGADESNDEDRRNAKKAKVLVEQDGDGDVSMGVTPPDAPAAPHSGEDDSEIKVDVEERPSA